MLTLKIKIACSIIFFHFTMISFSQETAEPDIMNITKVSFLDPGFSYEKRVGKFQSLYGQVFLNISGTIGYSSSFGNMSSIFFDPAFAISYRYYYNSAKRQSKGKRTDMNSLNYLSPIFKTIFSKQRISTSYYQEENRRPIYITAIAWGIQRNYMKRFSLDLNLGLGYLLTKSTMPDDSGQIITKNTGEFTTLIQLNLGFWLNNMK